MTDVEPSDLPPLPPDEFGDMRTDLVRACFGLESLPETWASISEAEKARFYEMLAERIREMMDESFEQLLAALYRFDVDERKAQQAFSEPNREAIARHLAVLIVERQLQRLRTRAQRDRTPFSE